MPALAAVAAVITFGAGCSGPIVFNPGPDYTDDVERAYAKAEQQHLRVATITERHWSRLEGSHGDVADQVQQASAPGNRLFLQVLREIDSTNHPAAPGLRAGMTDNCSYFPIGTDPNAEQTTAVARICLDNNGRVFGTSWRAIDR